MVGTLDQMISLASAVNAFLAGRWEPTGYYPTHQTFQFCKRVDFVYLEGNGSKPREIEVADTPERWLRLIRE